jgi:hypothetical protein
MIQTALRLATTSMLLLGSICAGANAGAANKDFDLKGVLHEQPGPSARCPTRVGGTIVGNGDSALIGRVVFIATDCIAPVGPLFTFSDGRFIITTTSGDQVFATYSGQFVPTGQGAKFVFSNATFQITGGNGQYAKASGGGTMTGDEDIVTGQGTVQLSGRIQYKDKN